MNDDDDANDPMPWERPRDEEREEDSSPSTVDGSGAGDLVDAGVEGASAGADFVGGALEGAGEVAGGVLEGLGGCADGCGGCSLAVLLMLFAATSTAMALFR